MEEPCHYRSGHLHQPKEVARASARCHRCHILAFPPQTLAPHHPPTATSVPIRVLEKPLIRVSVFLKCAIAQCALKHADPISRFPKRQRHTSILRVSFLRFLRVKRRRLERQRPSTIHPCPSVLKITLRVYPCS